MNDKSEANATASGSRLNLPVLGAIERGWDTYQPFLAVVGVYYYKDNPNDKEEKEKKGLLKEEPPPKSIFGCDVSDPPATGGSDDRGWSCPPSESCTWFGPV
ncbi:hypothetical protein [Streptomyces chartreusis]|uniref:hypothetical protein n=1 Tax=Streptomyces chartreusis TaxID=1969 RepID=UPI0004C4E2AD